MGSAIFQRYFSVILVVIFTILPVSLINLGWKLLSNWEQSRELARKEETVIQILESMSLKWNFKSQMSSFCAGFRTEIRREIEKEKNPDYGKLARKMFHSPFPHYDLWVFEFPRNELTEKNGYNALSPKIVHSPSETPLGKHPFVIAFKDMVSRNLGIIRSNLEDKNARKLIAKIFGPGLPVHKLGLSQRNIPTRVIYKNKIHYLYWDLIEKSNRVLAGFMLLVQEDSDSVFAGFDLARRLKTELREQGIISGFVRIFSNEVGDILHPRLRNLPSFRSWLKNFRNRHTLDQLEKKGTPWGVLIGNYYLYSQIIPHSTHLAIALIPYGKTSDLPGFIHFLNSMTFGIWVLVLVNGIFCNTWPIISLRLRFYGVFLLATLLPLSLAVVAREGYYQERRGNIFQELKQNLNAELRQIDLGKEQFQSHYLAAFNRIVNNQKVLAGLGAFGISGGEIVKAASKEFSTAYPTLPWAIIAFYDSSGKQIITLGPSANAFDIEGFMKFDRIAMVKSIRDQIVKAQGTLIPNESPFTAEEEGLWEAYHQISGSNHLRITAARAGIPQTIRAGRIPTTFIQGFISFGRDRKFGLTVAWRVNDLDKFILEAAQKSFLTRNPEGLMAGFRLVKEGFEPLIPNQKGLAAIIPLARMACESWGEVSKNVDRDGNLWGIAKPSLTMSDTIIAVAESTGALKENFQRKMLWIDLCILFSLLIILVLAKYAENRFVPAILSVKTGLDLVSSGNLHQNIRIEREDELGRLTHVFDEMIDKLRERRRLTTLVSSRALEAVSQHRFDGAKTKVLILVSDIRSFTAHCENQPVHIITELLNHHFEVMSGIISSHGGSIDKFIGDCIQAVFEIHAEKQELTRNNAIAAGLEMLSALERINALRKTRGLFPYAIGVGIGEGMAVSGWLGNLETHMELVHIGATVKTATCLESLSKLIPNCPLVLQADIGRNAPRFAQLLIPFKDHESSAMIFASHLTPDKILKALGPIA